MSQEHPPIVIKRFIVEKRLLVEKREKRYEDECKNFLYEAAKLYERCLEYLCKWMKRMEEFACLKEITSWKDVEPCLEYLIGKGVDLDGAKCFDQIYNLKQFVESYLQDEEFIKLPTHKKWCKYFDQSKKITCHSEILRIVQFFFAVASHIANVERAFSLMQGQWNKERNKLIVATMKGILTLQYNFKDIFCSKFFSFLKSDKALLKRIRSSEKYAWLEGQWNKERNKLSVATMKGILTLQYNFKDMFCSKFFSFLKSDKALLKKIRSSEKYAWLEE